VSLRGSCNRSIQIVTKEKCALLTVVWPWAKPSAGDEHVQSVAIRLERHRRSIVQRIGNRSHGRDGCVADNDVYLPRCQTQGPRQLDTRDYSLSSDKPCLDGACRRLSRTFAGAQPRGVQESVLRPQCRGERTLGIAIAAQDCSLTADLRGDLRMPRAAACQQ